MRQTKGFASGVKASYEEYNGEESNENQWGVDGDNGYDAPVEPLEEGIYLGEEIILYYLFKK